MDHARACVLTLSDMSTTNKAVVKIRKLFPQVPIVARARNPAHQQRLESMFGAYPLLLCLCVHSEYDYCYSGRRASCLS